MLIDAFESVVVFAVAMGFLGLSGDQQMNLMGLFIAILAVAKGFLVQPFPVTVIADLGRAALVFFVSVEALHLTADQITIAVTMLGTVLSLVARGQITPRYDPVVEVGGAGAGPVPDTGKGEAGAADILFIIGVVLAILGLLALILEVAGEAFVSLPVAILILAIGLILMAVARYRGTTGNRVL